MTTDDTSPEMMPTSFPTDHTSADKTQASSTSPPQLRRTWPQRLTIGGVFLAAIGCFAAGSGLYAAQRVIEDRNIVAIESGAPGDSVDDATFSPSAPGDGANDGGPAAQLTDDPNRPVETFPLAEPAARNFLITGADNNDCVDPDSPYAGAFGDRSSLGERSDTIMMWRVNPAASQVAVLSFPRDLWVTIADRSSKQRINSAYVPNQPQRLIDTIFQNFGIATDHYIQVDFCAFRTLIDAVDGVSVPFDRPIRDAATGLNVPVAGCFNFNGDHALAYVRSRKLQSLDENGKWITDGTSDLGRISRQQDFIRRTVDSMLSAGAFNPNVIRALIKTSDEFVVNDDGLTVNKMLEFAGVVKDIAPAEITSYQIEALGTTIQGNSVLLPSIDNPNMQAVLAVFRGQATLASAPEQVLTTRTTSAPPIDEGSAGDTPDAAPAPATTVDAVPFNTIPVVEAEDNNKGFFPDANISCS
ncbi:MAG: LCP family protein required for cell wall assembly [Ilumatobacter sp.]|jgi:LCP family protein required for cell wall assembly